VQPGDYDIVIDNVRAATWERWGIDPDVRSSSSWGQETLRMTQKSDASCGWVTYAYGSSTYPACPQPSPQLLRTINRWLSSS
jgi:hypothetical protein